MLLGASGCSVIILSDFCGQETANKYLRRLFPAVHVTRHVYLRCTSGPRLQANRSIKRHSPERRENDHESERCRLLLSVAPSSADSLTSYLLVDLRPRAARGGPPWRILRAARVRLVVV